MSSVHDQLQPYRKLWEYVDNGTTQHRSDPYRQRRHRGGDWRLGEMSIRLLHCD